MSADGERKTRVGLRSLLDLLSSTGTAIVLLVLIAAAAAVGTLLPEDAAQAYVYGRAWFHVVLGVLGLNLLVCMVWRRRIGMVRFWSLLTHGGILLILVGAMVTLISAERGVIVIHEGQTVDSFSLRGDRKADPVPLGFAVRLVDFRIERYPAVSYLRVRRQGGRDVRLRIPPTGSLEIPGTGHKMENLALMPGPGGAVVEVSLPDGTSAAFPAEVGASHKLGGGGAVLRVLRYEPSFKIDVESKKVTSDTDEPINPALQVQLVRGEKAEVPRWLFAKVPGFGQHHRHGSKQETSPVELRFLHPSYPVLEAEALTPSGTKRVRIAQGSFVPSPWEREVLLGYERESRVKEYESEVEVLEEGKVVKRHVIRVNAPLVHEGTKLSQASYDEKGLRWSGVGVSRDSGVWFVYAGFIVAMHGLMGRFYVSPFLRQIRARAQAKGGNDESSC